MALEIFDACKAFGGVPVLDRFSLSFPPSGTVCLFGPSGCGKTTLLNCIAGLERLDSGSVSGARGLKISYLFQEDRLLPWCTAEENVAAAVRGRGQDAAREWLRLVGLGNEGGKYPAELSGGMRRRVAAARSLVFGGDLYLLDEPFRGLDARRREELAVLFEKNTPGKLTLLVTHDRTEAERLADVTLVLDGPPLRVVTTVRKKENQHSV